MNILAAAMTHTCVQNARAGHRRRFSLGVITSLIVALGASLADESVTLETLTLGERRTQLGTEVRLLIEGAAGKSLEERAQLFKSWREASKERLEVLAADITAANEQRRTPTRPLISKVEIPEGANAEVEDFLVEKAKLHNEEVLHVDAPFPRTSEAWQDRLNAWESTNRARIEQQQRLGQIVAQQSEPPALRIQDAPNIPRHASPELKSYLMLRYELNRDQINEESRIRSLPPPERETWVCLGKQ
jgi:hypothetical protein